VTLAAAGAGCAHTINYFDPAGPKYESAPAPPADPAACADPARVLTVATFNIEYAKEIDRALDAIRSDPALRAADVLLLQEMDRPGVERIAAALSMNYVFFPSGVHPRTHRDFGTAILTHWSLEDERKIVLPHKGWGSNLLRAVTAARVVCGAQRVEVMSVHLPSPVGANYDERVDQIDTILASARAIEGPLVVGGDFNAGWVASYFEKAGFTWLNKHLGGTASVLWMTKRLDYMFVRGMRPAENGAPAGISDNKGASDHKPLWVRLQFER